MEQSISLPLVRVLVDRGRDKIRVDCPEHEVRVLQAVHGVAEVKIIEKDVDDRVFDPSATAEWDRLDRTYRRTGVSADRSPVAVAYRNGPADLEQFGFSTGLKARQGDDVRAFDAKKDARDKAKAAKSKA